eukprot:g1805.t1
MHTPTCRDVRIRRLSLHKALPQARRKDVLVFGALYVMAATIAMLSSNPTLSTGALIALPVLVFLNVVAWLSTQWSVRVRCLVAFSPVSDVADADVVHVVPSPLCGSPALAVLHQGAAPHFMFQCLKYRFSEEGGGAFEPPTFPVDLELSTYLAKGGLGSDAKKAARARWGRNLFDIPLPPFMELFKQHAVAPFFAFQVFCVLLWCLDEYWYYSLFTLAMLIVFECTVVKQRIRNLETLRAMRRPPHRICAYRLGKWQVISSEDLVPGDLVSVARPRVSGADGEDVLFPCDVLLLSGACIVNEAMLTGESVPQMKDPLNTLSTAALRDTLSLKPGAALDHQKHVVCGGTKVVQSSPGQRLDSVPNPPDGGCIGFVLRTGFGTSQGELMRTILFSTDHVTVANAETGMFIGFLLIFAVAASAYVLHQGLQDEKRSRYKLMLHCIMIITSVVPPELPMELSLAVNNSLMALSKKGIFCTEPFRIPFAGRVDTCCFDKTGTLTADNLVMQGVATSVAGACGGTEDDGATGGRRRLVSANELEADTTYILAGCHSLVFVDGQYTGDPAEMAAAKAIGWSFSASGMAVPPGRSKLARVRIEHRYPFSSSLKRMSAIAVLSQGRDSVPADEEVRLLSKGAPEVMRPLFADCPEYYDSTYLRYTARGCRVLALGWRPLGSVAVLPGVCQTDRCEAEAQLRFAGFLVLQCPLKRESKKCVKELLDASHAVVMITGDNPLTAHDVARQVGIAIRARGEALFLVRPGEPGSGVCWVSSKTAARGRTDREHEFTVDTLPTLSRDFDLIATGDALTELGGGTGKSLSEQQLALWTSFCPRICVFARTSPDQKELVLAALKASGKTTLMCGDGTNDVGALKQADVGISIINSPVLEDMERAISESKKQLLKQQRQAETVGTETARSAALRNRKRATKEPPAARGSGSGGVTASTTMQQRQELVNQLMELEDQQSMVQLGDASIASPFTSKSSSIASTITLIRQGRCTLVTTLQMFKILALNCLTTAYMLTFLFLMGVKQGDQQMTVYGMYVAGCFLFISRAQPLKKLATRRPQPKVFCFSVITSLMVQFAVHLACLILAVDITRPFVDAKDPAMEPDGEFKPNVINSVVFLLSAIMQINTFSVNYHGHPYMQSLRENTLMWKAVMVGYGCTFTCALEIFTPLNDVFELVALPVEPVPSFGLPFQQCIVLLMVADTVLVLAFDIAWRKCGFI